MIMLVTSKKNEAGINIARKCEKLGLKVHYCEEDILEINKLPEAEAYMSLSTHKSESKMPCLTSHFPGVFSNDTSFGGNAKELAYTYPSLQKIYMQTLNDLKGAKPELEKYQVVVEATHHGPTHFKKPVLFVEIGSSEEEWREEAPAELIAKAVKKTIELIKVEKFTKIGIAFGGTHYPEKFTEVILKGEFAIGHIFPKYQSENMDEPMFDQMVKKSVEPVKYVLIDWKGINNKSRIVEWAKNKGFEVVKI
jgi:D-aminoacyl-tRNA deacylase